MRVESDAARMSRQLAAARSGSPARAGARDAARWPRIAVARSRLQPALVCPIIRDGGRQVGVLFSVTREREQGKSER